MEPRPLPDDLVLLLQACTAAIDGRVLADVVAHAGRRVRHADGYVFQHLVESDRSITELAGLLGVTQQAASKQVDDLTRRGLVERRASADDGRVRLVSLTPAGRGAVDAGRAARAAIDDQIAATLGRHRATALKRSLHEVAVEFGADELVARRAFRPESAR